MFAILFKTKRLRNIRDFFKKSSESIGVRAYAKTESRIFLRDSNS